MAKKKDEAPAQPKPITYGGEVHCQKCQGMVNHNGCAEVGCPIRRKE